LPVTQARSPSAYQARFESQSHWISVRGLRYHVRSWQTGTQILSLPLILLHGWMDVSASFQFVVDALQDARQIFAPDWRGFGLSERGQSDSYWFPDYIADLDALLDVLVPEGPVDLVAHSMGGNVALLYAGVRPERVRRVVNLEGVGMPPVRPTQAPNRYRRWLDDLKASGQLRDYASLDEVAARLMKTNPRLSAEKGLFLAGHWARQCDDGRFELLGDPAHKRTNPILYRVPEVLACWRAVTASVLWVESEFQSDWYAFTHTPAYQRRLTAIQNLSRARIAQAGHMMHHDQPQAVAALVEDFCR
jgi:pimeloyl-ACP methyl ester carboxylesterase